jgi:hypothetical protein
VLLPCKGQVNGKEPYIDVIEWIHKQRTVLVNTIDIDIHRRQRIIVEKM